MYDLTTGTYRSCVNLSMGARERNLNVRSRIFLVRSRIFFDVKLVSNITEWPEVFVQKSTDNFFIIAWRSCAPFPAYPAARSLLGPSLPPGGGLVGRPRLCLLRPHVPQPLHAPLACVPLARGGGFRVGRPRAREAAYSGPRGYPEDPDRAFDAPESD